MGAFSYCRNVNCDCGLDRATVQEVVEGHQYCENGHDNSPNATLGDIVQSLSETVEALQAKIEKLESANQLIH